eukprot:SAG11_NODE_1003_length_6211_cov_6.104548_4_plen_153_part_00
MAQILIELCVAPQLKELEEVPLGGSRPGFRLESSDSDSELQTFGGAEQTIPSAEQTAAFEALVGGRADNGAVRENIFARHIAINITHVPCNIHAPDTFENSVTTAQQVAGGDPLDSALQSGPDSDEQREMEDAFAQLKDGNVVSASTIGDLQ